MVRAAHLARHVTRERQHRRMVAACFIEAGDQMRAAGPRGAAAYAQPSRQFGLAGGGKRGAFLVADADPFKIAPSDGIGERIERVADQSENLPDTDFLQNFDEYVRYRLSHRCLLPIRAGACFRKRLKTAFENRAPSILRIKVPSEMSRCDHGGWPAIPAGASPNLTPLASLPSAVRTAIATATVPATTASANP